MNKISPFLRKCLLLLLLALMVAWDSTAQRFEPRIVFASNRDGDWDIYSMDVNGNNVLQLTDHPADDKNPACSPDGRRIAFDSERGLTSDMYAMDRDGNNVIRLTRDDSREGRASWSPDGKKIAFVSAPNFGAEDARHIFVMNADGKGRRNLTGNTNLKYNWNPNWSPDGRKIAFQSQRVFEGYEIYEITAEGKNLKQLTQGGNNRMPVYVRDGRKIAFVSTRDGDFNIYLMEANGRNAVKLTRTPPGIDNVKPSWLPSALAVNPNGKLPISWGKLKRTRNLR